MEFGALLRNLRKESGLTQAELGEGGLSYLSTKSKI